MNYYLVRSQVTSLSFLVRGWTTVEARNRAEHIGPDVTVQQVDEKYLPRYQARYEELPL